jgi:hypothetical protein
MRGNAQICLVIEQAVNHMGGLTGRRDCHRVVRRLASGEMRVEQRGDLAPIMGVDRTDSLARPAGREVLAIRAGHIGGAEQARSNGTRILKHKRTDREHDGAIAKEFRQK